MPSNRLKVAVAASGLAHVKRGVETWAEDLGTALRRKGVDATTFQGSANADGSSGVVVGCWKRTDSKTQRAIRLLKKIGGWRFGLSNSYDLEQATFALNLFPQIYKEYDILHVQDPVLGLIFERLHSMRLSKPRVVMAHGTEEDASMLRKYSYLQHLAPNYLEDWIGQKPKSQMAFAIPNLVDVQRFCPPATASAKKATRAACGLPEDALIVLSVGALKKTHKRMDYLLREFAAWQQSQALDAILVIAGAREWETDAVLEIAATLPAGTVKIFENAPRSQVVELLQTADIFALASLHEMLGNAVLEALATGLPIACNSTPTLRWMVGDAGPLTDIRTPGAMAEQFAVLQDGETRRAMSEAAVAQARQTFSEPVVVGQIEAMYEQVLAK